MLNYLFIFTGILISILLFPEQSILSKSDISPAYHQVFFLCELQDDNSVRCEPSGTNVVSYSVTGQSDSLYTVSSPLLDYVKGTSSAALHLNEKLGESFDIVNNTSLNPSQFSVSLFIKPHSNFTGMGQILSHVNFNLKSGWYISLDNRGLHNELQFIVLNDKGETFATDPIRVSDKSYTHITCIFDGMKVKLFENGILNSSINFSGTYNPDPNIPLKVGVASYSEDQWWVGTIDELKFFGRAISAQEVNKLSVNGNISTDRELGHWTFDNNLFDSSNNKNNIVYHLETVGMGFAPDGRLFFTVKNTGEIRIMKDDKVLEKPFAVVPNNRIGDHQGLLGIAIDPHFRKNHFLYAYSTYQDPSSLKIFNRILRYTESAGVGTNMTVIMDKIPADPGGYYAGGALAFGPDDKLYVTVGIGTHPELSQNKSSLLGKVLRINRDGSIPSDNPFQGSPVYTIGNKNPYGLAFSSEGTGIITDNGEAADDEINVLQPGKDYGFPFEQGFKLESNRSYISPVRDYYTVIAPTQAIFYDGNNFPSLKGSFLIGSFNRGHIYAVKLYQNTSKILETEIFFPFAKHDSVISLAKSPNGEIYFGGYEIHKLKSIDQLSGRQISFPIAIDMSNGTHIKAVEYNNENKSLIFHFQTDAQSNGLYKADINVPKSLLSGIYLVKSVADKFNMDLTKNILTYEIHNVRGGSPVTSISFSLKPNVTASVSVLGTNPLNPYSFSGQ